MRPLPRCRRRRGRGQGPASRVRGAGRRPLAERQAAASPGPCRPLQTRARAASRAKAWGQNVPDSQRQNLGWGQGSGSVGPWGSQGGRPAGLDGSHGAGPPGSGFGRPAWGSVYRANRKRPREQGRRSPGRRKAGGPSEGRTNNNSEKENNEKSRLLRGRKAGRCGRPGQGRRLQTSPEARAGPRSGDTGLWRAAMTPPRTFPVTPALTEVTLTSVSPSAKPLLKSSRRHARPRARSREGSVAGTPVTCLLLPPLRPPSQQQAGDKQQSVSTE